MMDEYTKKDLEIPEGCEKPANIVLDVIKEFYDGMDGFSFEKDFSTGGCKAFYHPEEWRDRGEDYGISTTAVLVLVHDGGGLAEFCDWNRQNYSWMEKLQDALDAQGYIMEQCTCWYSAVYNKERKPKTHWLKTWPQYFQAMANGTKRFELRKDDREFEVNDKLRLREWDPDTKEYTGQEVTVSITYILEGEQAWKFGLDEGYVLMSTGDPHRKLNPE